MSEIRANTVSNAAGTGPATLTGQYAAKAWVNFNGSGTVAIRESGNVSSITDSGTGTYDVNFTASLTDGNYSQLADAGQGNPSDRVTSTGQIALSSSVARIRASGTAGNVADAAIISFIAVR